MPQAIPLIAKAIAVYVGANAAVQAAVLITASLLVGAYEQDKAKRKARKQFEASLRDNSVVIRSPVMERNTVYGRRMVSGPLVFFETSGQYKQYLHMVVALADHESDGWEEIYLNDIPLGTLDSDGFTTEGEFYRLDKENSRTESVVPVVGGTHTLTREIVSGVNVALYLSGDGGTEYFQRNVDFTVSGNEVTWLNTSKIAFYAAAGTALSISYKFGRHIAYVRARVKLGVPGQVADPDLVSEVPTKWTTAHRGDGVTYVYVRLQLNTDVFPNGPPNVKVLLRGKKVYDPRTALTAWSRNPVLHSRDYLKSLGVIDAELDDTTFVAEANVCDEDVSISGTGTTEKRYSCDLDLSQADDPLSNLAAIASTMGGHLVLTGGVWKVFAGRYRTPVMTLSDDDLISTQPVTTIPRAPRDQLFNGVRGVFIDPKNYWQESDFPPYLSTVYKEEDGGVELVQDLELAGVTSEWQAQRLAKMMLHRSRQSLTQAAAFWWKALPLQPGDFVYRNSERYGWTNKVFQVLETEVSIEGGVQLLIQEESATSYDWSYTEARGKDPAPNTTLPDAFNVDAPTGLTCYSGDDALLLSSDGTLISRILISWDEPQDENVLNGGKAEVQYRPLGTTRWLTLPLVPGLDTSIYTDAVRDGFRYEVRVRFINGIQVKSAWTYLDDDYHTVIGKTAVPSDVPALFASLEAFGIRLEIQQVTDKDVRSYELREGGLSWAGADFITRIAATPASPSQSLKYLHQQMQAGSRTFRVKAIDSLGQESVNDTTTVLALSAGTITGVSHVINGPNVELTWTATQGSFPIVKYRIYYGATFGTATYIADAFVTRYNTKVNFGGTRRYWIVAVDQYGNESTAGFEDVTITNPLQPVLEAEVIDNNIILRFSDCTTTLPVDKYVISRGEEYVSSTVVGDNGNGRFAMFFEQVQGTYTYWVVAIDTAGNSGTPASQSVYMGQPPDYVLQDDSDFVFDGSFTYSNAASINNRAVLPVDTTETWADHFVDNGWTTPQQQVDAGFPIYAQPNVASGYVEREIDYGAVLPATNIQATMTYDVIGGGVPTVTYQISYKNALSDPWTDAPTGPFAFASDFRYVKVRVTVDRPSGNSATLVEAIQLNVKLATKTIRDQSSGPVDVFAADAGGTLINFNIAFVDIDDIQVTVRGTTPRYVAVNFTDGPNPTSFRVLLFDTAGARVNGSITWNATGK